MSFTAQGIDLRGWFCQGVLGATNVAGEFQPQCAWQSAAPNICVLPRFRWGEPQTSFAAINSHWGRGSGLPYGSSCETARDLLRRMPGWLLWLGLHTDAVTPVLTYSSVDSKKETLPLYRIAAAHFRELQRARPLSDDHCNPDAVGCYAVAMPDYFQERAQETLYDALPYPREKSRLLWSSVAVCLAWIASLDPSDAGQYAGKRVAVVEAHLAEVSATILELRNSPQGGRPFLVPKRDLPEEGSSQSWAVLPFDLCLAATLLAELSPTCTLREIWQVATGGLASFLVQGRLDIPEALLLIETPSGWKRVQPPADYVPEAVRAAASCAQIAGFDDLRAALHEALPDRATDEPLRCRSLAETFQCNVASWLESRPKPAEVILLVGPVAALSVNPQDSLGAWLAEELSKKLRCPILAPGRDFDPQCVTAACGCAIYGGRELVGLPTYLDTLPRFCIVGKDRLHWKDVECDLVPQAECEGGKEYRPTKEELERLQKAAMIPQGQRAVRFRLRRQGKEKQLEQDFERAPLRDCYLSFDVALRPAQGFARVYITAEQPDLFPSGRVLLDWKKMEDAKPLEELPPDFPVCHPIDPKPTRGPFSPDAAIEELARAVGNRLWDRAADLLEQLGKALGSGAAYGSDPRGWAIERYITALEAYHCNAPQDIISSTGGRKTLARAASVLFARAPAWGVEMIVDEFRVKAKKDPDDPNVGVLFLIAAGRCFRGESAVRLFVDCFAKHLARRKALWRSKGRTPGMNNWCKAFQLIFRLNDEAVLWLSPEEARQIAADLACLLQATQPQQGQAKAPYVHAMLSVYYLLRFRARPDGAHFLTDWNQRGTAAYQIHENLSRNKSARLPRMAAVVSGGQSVQSALLHFLESRATVQDIVIMKEVDDAAILEGGEKD